VWGVYYLVDVEELELEELELGAEPGVPEVVVDEVAEVLLSEAVEGARPRFLEVRTTSS